MSGNPSGATRDVIDSQADLVRATPAIAATTPSTAPVGVAQLGHSGELAASAKLGNNGGKAPPPPGQIDVAGWVPAQHSQETSGLPGAAAPPAQRADAHRLELILVMAVGQQIRVSATPLVKVMAVRAPRWRGGQPALGVA
jgi:hypothetical protein